MTKDQLYTQLSYLKVILNSDYNVDPIIIYKRMCECREQIKDLESIEIRNDIIEEIIK